MAAVRRAVVVFLTGEVEQTIDAIRHRWDPTMAGRIDAHITLVHDVTDGATIVDRVAAVAAEVAPFELTLTTTACWGPAKWGIYLDLEDHDGGVWGLHDRLADLEDPRWLRGSFRPHVTLVHGRTVSEEQAEEAWAALNGFRADLRTCADAMCLIESRPGGWRTTHRFELTGGASVASAHG